MPVKLTKIPQDVEWLLRDGGNRTVVVGNDAYTVAPLAAGQSERLATVLSNMLMIMGGEVIAAANQVKREGISAEGEEGEAVLDAVGKGVRKLVESGDIITLSAEVLGMTEEDVRENLTIPQMYHLGAVVWEQNFDMKNAPEGVRKNFQSLLDSAGVNRADKKMVQWADSVMRILIDQSIGSEGERIDMVLQIAYEIGLTERPPAEMKQAYAEALKSLSQQSVPTPDSPTGSDSPESTSTEPE